MPPRRALSAGDVRVRKKETPFRGYFRVERYHLRHRLFEGGWSDAMTREVFERGHAVGVLLYDPDRDVLVLIEQFLAGANEATFDVGEAFFIKKVAAGTWTRNFNVNTP